MKLICPLCQAPLAELEGGVGCAAGHRFDRARQGYLNLLPVQHKKSLDPGDNAAMESFFALLQNNVLNRQHWATRQDLRLAIITWIERTYHRRRRQTRLARLTPIEYETIMTTTALEAA